MKTKKCKHCKEPFFPWNSLQKYCIKDYCINVMINEAKQKEWSKRKSKMKSDLMTASDYKKIAQQVFNKYIRLRDAGQVCISCQKPAKKENAGHYFSSGGHSNVTFDEFNVHLQCEYCNTSLSGNLIEYRKHLKKRIGDDQMVLLEQRAYLTKKWSIEELKEVIEIYKKKVKELKK